MNPILFTDHDLRSQVRYLRAQLAKAEDDNQRLSRDVSWLNRYVIELMDKNAKLKARAKKLKATSAARGC